MDCELYLFHVSYRVFRYLLVKRHHQQTTLLAESQPLNCHSSSLVWRLFLCVVAVRLSIVGARTLLLTVSWLSGSHCC